MPRAFRSLLLLAALGAASPALADATDQACSTGTAERRIPACTKILDRVLAKSTRATVLYRRGLAYADKGDDNHAVEDFTASLNLRPRDATTLNARAEAFGRLDKTDEALADYASAIDADKAAALPLINLSLIHI